MACPHSTFDIIQQVLNNALMQEHGLRLIGWDRDFLLPGYIIVFMLKSTELAKKACEANLWSCWYFQVTEGCPVFSHCVYRPAECVNHCVHRWAIVLM